MGGTFSYSTEELDNRRYGWKQDLIDNRDKIAKFTDFNNTIDLTETIDLREECPNIYDQGKLGSCTANAIAFAYQFDEKKQKESDIFIPSRLFIYFNERDMESTVSSDSGASIRDGIKSINSIGVCSETDWPYDISTFTQKPSEYCYAVAKNHRTVIYKNLKGGNSNSLLMHKKCLESGYPFVFGIPIYESFETQEAAISGKIPMPKSDEKLLGGHALSAVGYDENNKWFIVRNSWGADWGDSGYCYIPYEYIEKYGNDFWYIRSVEDSV